MSKLDGRITFWKTIGGYLSCVKWHGRWYYLTNSGTTLIAWEREAKAQGYTLERIQGVPVTLSRIWQKYGGTQKAFQEHLPHWPGWR